MTTNASDAARPESTADHEKERLDNRLKDWKRRLLDLTYRNNLIKYSPRETASLDIALPQPSILLDEIRKKEHLGFFYPPEDEPDQHQEDDRPDQRGPDLPDSGGRIVAATKSRKRLIKTLDNLARRSRSDYNEKALRVLYLGVGFLHWTDEKGEPLNSPLALVPVELRRSSLHAPYDLHLLADEEIVINPTLKAKIEADRGLALPEDWAWENKPLTEELDDVRKAVEGTGWEVSDRVVLSIFSFEKMVMFQDLKSNAKAVTSHPTIRALALERRQQEDHARSRSLPDAEEIEKSRQPSQSFSILDADSSQRRCIEAARQGISFVMQGPPGTGKSQTIANIIAECLGDGKKVLFVSAKIAALEVVRNRLAKEGLDSLCMDLHGDKATRARVVTELHSACQLSLSGSDAMSTAEHDQLQETRETLNRICAKLNTPRDELHGFTPHHALGLLAKSQNAPAVAEAPDLPDLEPDEAIRRYNETMRQFRAAATVWDLALDFEHPWREFTNPGIGGAETRNLKNRTERFAQAAEALARQGHIFATELGLSEQPTIEDVNRWVELGRLVESKPDFTGPALDAGKNRSLLREIEAAAQAYSGLSKKEEAHAATYRSRRPSGFPDGIGDDLGKRLDELERIVGRTTSWEESLPDDIRKLAELCADAPQLMHEIEVDSAMLRAHLGQPASSANVEEARSLAELARLAHLPADRPDPQWLNRFNLEKARSAFDELAPKITECHELLKAIREEYTDEVFHLDVDQLQLQLRVAEDQVLGQARRPFREARNILRQARKDGRTPKEPLRDVSRVRRYWEVHSEILNAEALRLCLGAWDKGVETDVDGVSRALDRAARILELSSPKADRLTLSRAVGLGGEPDETILDASDRLMAACDQIAVGLAALRSISALRRISDPESMPLDEVAEILSKITPVVSQLNELIEELSNGMIDPAPDLEALCAAGNRIDSINASHRRIAESKDRWQTLFGADFAEEGTDWDLLREKANWIQLFYELYPDGATIAMRRHLLGTGNAGWPDFARLEEALTSCRRTLAVLSREFNEERAAEMRQMLDEASVDRIEQFGSRLLDSIDSLPRWADLADAKAALEEQGWGGYLDAAIKARIPQYQVEDSAKHAYWEAALTRYFSLDSELASFKGSGHKSIIEEFNRLDEKVIKSAAARIMDRHAKRREAGMSQLGDAVDTITREAGKQRHRWSVKRLLAEIGDLLHVLKPCLMMSPMTVSQFLSPDHHFDVVIFDEASQVPPWEAINCIYRGDQLIVAGDSKQLPPTRFFTAQEIEEAESSETSESNEKREGHQEVMESILDACGTILPSERLRWHYRSKHEDLIVFSNRHFYNNDLVTFPSPDLETPHKGVHFIYVEDGVYDRGRSQMNRIEAKRVAERVFEHLERDPSRTLGVVTFNTRQRDAVNDALEMVRRERPDMEHLFGDDRMEGLFVKNLESVQGDERDVIIFSIGYGRDENGKFTMNFGALNSDQGERRLNVAVTRAREQVDLIASVRPEDFRIGPGARPGVQRLRDYIDFAANGRSALPKALEALGGDFDSPFERAVAEAIRDAGYEIVPQVGAGGFRIDLGVIDPDSPGRFVLGVECDGATYHSTPSARDRDRLRQRVLEGLGWKIHRIWSRDWVRNPESEMTALCNRIEALRSHEMQSPSRSTSAGEVPEAPDLVSSSSP